MLKIIYDNQYNFHEGYNGEIVRSTSKDILWVKGTVSHHFEGAIRSSQKEVRKSILNIASFISDNPNELVFSPHLLIDDQNINYFIDLEDIYWLFGDTYQEVGPNAKIPTWKIEIFKQKITADNLKHIFWWSNAAIQRFKEFCKNYELDDTFIKNVLNKSSVLYPSSRVISKKSKSDTKENHFIIVGREKDFKRKGIDIVLEIFTKLYDQGIKNFRLDIYGGIPSKYSKNLPDNIRVNEKITRDELLDKLSEASVLLFPSRADTFGTILTEAANTGIYIIASHGKSVFASKEILESYPNHKIIESNQINGDNFDLVDIKKFELAIRNLITKPQPLKQWTSPYRLEVTRTKFLKEINKIKTNVN